MLRIDHIWVGAMQALHALPLDTVIAGLALALSAVLIMYLSAKANVVTHYESRRSIQLREAAKQEGRVYRSDHTVMRDAHLRSVVYFGNTHERRRWCDALGASPEELKAAIREVGPMSADVKRYLRARSRPEPPGISETPNLESRLSPLPDPTWRRNVDAL